MSSRWIRLTAIVAEREIRQRGRSRAFLISTIVLLLVVVAGVAIPAILAHSAKPQRVGIVGGQLAAMTEIVREAGRLTGTGVTVVPQPGLASAEGALRSGRLDVVLASDSEVVVKQVSVTDFCKRAGLSELCCCVWQSWQSPLATGLCTTFFDRSIRKAEDATAGPGLAWAS